MKRTHWLGMGLLILAGGFPALAQPSQNEAKAGRGPMLVNVDWLGAHLHDPAVVLLQIGDRKEYEEAHIPGAQYLQYMDISTPHGQGLMLELPPVEQLVSVFEKLGVSNESHVILYFGKDWWTPTTRVYWTLDYMGLGDHTSILDGGLPAWRGSGQPVTSDTKEPAKGSIKPATRPEIVADAAWVSSHLGQPDVTILDARSHEFYNGSKGDGTPRKGHIPGATNLPYTDVVDQSTNKLKNEAALRDLFHSAGLKPGNLMVSYCHIGQRATVLYFTAKLLGYDAKMYDGSWEDWSHRRDLPIVTGESPNKL